MTFADKLEELLKRDSLTLQEAAEKRFSLDDLLANNADAILELVREAEELLEATTYDNEYDYIGHKVCCGVLSYKPHKKQCRLNNIFIKLNGEKT